MRILRRLRTKLTVLYAGLFCAALLLIGTVVYVVIQNTVQQQVRQQLAATGVVFDSVWELRFGQLRDGARLASRDYGFREAVATQDEPTIISALANLRHRLGIDLVFLVTLDGRVIGDGAAFVISQQMQAALDADEAPYGVLETPSGPQQAVAMPVLAPNLHGWVVVGERLNDGEMRALERLAAIPLRAEVFTFSDAGAPPRALSALVERAQGNDAIGPVDHGAEAAIALAKPLHSLDGTHSVLVLRYPIAAALAPYRTLFSSLLAIGVMGLAVLIAGSWALANGITQPISSLSLAARKLQAGVYEAVVVNAKDELGDLADSFNAMIGALQDRERKIFHLAYHDTESRLPNRLALERRLAADTAAPLYLAAIGIDRFVQVRDAIGYAHAEALIRHLGARLAKLAPNAPTARLSNDVLSLAFPATSEEQALERLRHPIERLEKSVTIDGLAIDIHLTVGVSRPRAPEEPPSSIVRRASIALDQARAQRVKIALFDEAAYGNPAHNLSLMGDMRRGLVDGSLYLAHQPKYNYRTNCIDGVETLIRWRHPARGMIGPDVFVPMAEETGHIRAMTDWVLQQTIIEQAQLAEAGWPLKMSINISGRLLGDEDFARCALSAAKTTTGALCFEITETALIDNPTTALRNIQLFVEAGIEISIDDYGSGLSSLAYLKQLPAHELKIDKMFIQNLTQGRRDALLVRSTIDLAHGLGLRVTAEGIEQPAAFALLAGMGCDMAQGHFISRAVPLAELFDVLADCQRIDHFRASARPTAA